MQCKMCSCYIVNWPIEGFVQLEILLKICPNALHYITVLHLGYITPTTHTC